MNRQRWLVGLGLLLVTAVLAFVLRDVVYAAVVVPLAYVFYVLKIYYSMVPQVLLWIILLTVLIVSGLSLFAPDFSFGRKEEARRRSFAGQVETLATWITKSQRGNYFKWQIANRLGKIELELEQNFGWSGQSVLKNEAVETYFDAGLNHSFVDYQPQNRFQTEITPLDLDPKEAIDYLEKLVENNGGRHP